MLDQKARRLQKLSTFAHMLLTAVGIDLGIVRCQNYIMEGSCLIMNICVDAPNGGWYQSWYIKYNRKGIRIICLKGYYWSWMFARMLLTAVGIDLSIYCIVAQTEKRQGRSCWVMDICAQSLITVGIELSNLGV
uniref:Uncharacterized protein n=1 Tax=Rhizophagus irregularis (strain DAOM 181602 / DAOM 197198 / MUCL 43194) TaxID=747089 RepID=U9UKA8_RHIID